MGFWRSRYGLFIILGTIYYCYEFFLRIIPAAILPELAHFLSLNTAAVTAILSTYFLANFAAQPFVGLILTRYSAISMMIWSVMLCALACILSIMSNPMSFIAARVIMGFASAFSVICLLHIVRNLAPEKDFTLITSIILSIGMLIAAFGEVVAVAWMRIFDWQHLFIFLLVLGAVIAWVLYWARIPASYENRLTFRLAFQQLPTVIFSPSLWQFGIIGGCLYAPTAVLATIWGHAYFKSAYGLNAYQVAWLITNLYVGWVIGGPLFALIGRRLECPRLILFLSALLLLPYSYVLFFHPSPLILGHANMMFFLFGFISGGQLLVWQVIPDYIPPARSALSIAIFNMIIMLVVWLGDASVSVLLKLHPYFGIVALPPDRFALLSIPFCFSIAMLASLYRPQ